jgi:hypothetical protein
MAQPVGPDQSGCLQALFPRNEAEVGVDDIDQDAIEVDHRPQGTARLQPR